YRMGAGPTQRGSEDLLAALTMRDRQERNDGQRCRQVALVCDRRAHGCCARRRADLRNRAVAAAQELPRTAPRACHRAALPAQSGTRTKSRSPSRAPVSGVRARKSRPCAVALKKIEQGGRPCSQDAFQRYAYASKFLGDRDGGGFAPACSSQDLDRVGRRRCPPLSLAGWTLSHLG